MMTRIPFKRRNSSSQAGMVSIMVTMIMMLVISLIVLGFAQISRRERRQSLDRQLSTQAFFAAETGINDVRDVIQKLAAGTTIPEKLTCGSTPEYPATSANPVIDPSNDVSYTCLLVTTRLNNIHVTPLTAGGSSVSIPLEPVSGHIGTLHINWKALTTPALPVNNCANAVPATGYFPKNAPGLWACPYGVLRMDIVPTDDLSRAATTAGQKTIFFYPVDAGGSTSIGYASANGAVTPMYCQPMAGSCSVDVTGMPAGTTNYALRLSALYVTGTVDITADAGREFKNAQIQVDATGKARDVLRRVQVRLPIVQTGNNPDFAIESASSVCKRFRISGSYFEIPTDIKDPDANNPMCTPLVVQVP